MKKIFFIFGVFVFQSCWAMDSNSNRPSDISKFFEQNDLPDQIEDNFTNQEHYEGKDLIFYFFNTGQGNCTLVK